MQTRLNSFLFSMPQMTDVFSPEQQLRAMMQFEWALTCALEKQGLAEAGSGSVLESLLDAKFLDIDSLVEEAAQNGNIAIPFVRQLTAEVKKRNEVAARTVHLGATSQDVLDTALVLQMKEAFHRLITAMDQLDRALVNQVRTHRHTILAGRTWLQPGPPTTLGLKLAGTLAAVRRNRDRMNSAAGRCLVLQFGGAVGTLSALGTVGQAVSAELARGLELSQPDLPWHTQRDNLVEIVQVLAILSGTLSKFARDIALLMQAEVGEVSEGRRENLGGSSTMPHKRNPVASAAVIAAHARMPGLVATMLNAMPQEHERGLGLWQAEWETVPEAFRLVAAALARSISIAEGLEVDEARMKANWDALRGLPLSESISAALAPKIGKSRADELLRAAVSRAEEENWNLARALKHDPEVAAHLSGEEIDRLLDPRAYLGCADSFIAQVLGEEDANG